jgi:HlyD family secretion protein
VEKGLVSQQEFEESQDELEYLTRSRELLTTTQLQDSLSRAEQIRQFDESLDLMHSNLGLIRKKLDDLVVRAPVSGLLSALDAEVGQVKSAGDRLGQIDILDGYKVRAAVDEHYITRVRRGQTASLLVSEAEHKLVVDKVYPRVVSGRFDVDIVFVGDEIEELRQGRTIQLRLELSDPSTALLLPQGGFLSATGGRWVYLLDDSGDVARRHEIVIGNRNPQHCEVLEGLESGDRVIVSSYGLFGDANELILK